MKLAYRLIGPRLYIHYRARRALLKARDGHEGELRLLPSIVPRNRVAIDIGANRGNYTYFLSSLAAHTVAYEPAPDMAQFLRQACLPRVEVRETAVSNVRGRRTYFAPLNRHDQPQYNVGHLVDGSEAPANAGVYFPVTAIRLDDENLLNVGFIKIDVEGHEQQVIEGAASLLVRDRPNLIVEILEGSGDRVSVARNRTVRFLASLGYTANVFCRGTVCPLRNASLSRNVINYVFLPRQVPTVTLLPKASGAAQ